MTLTICSAGKQATASLCGKKAVTEGGREIAEELREKCCTWVSGGLLVCRMLYPCVCACVHVRVCACGTNCFVAFLHCVSSAPSSTPTVPRPLLTGEEVREDLFILPPLPEGDCQVDQEPM